MRRALLVALAVAGCASAPPPRERDKVDDLARAFTRFVHEHYAVRLAAEMGNPPPPVRTRRELDEALAALGLELPDRLEPGAELRKAVETVRSVLVAHDYVFLPLGQGGETEDDDLGIALAHVRERRAAQSMELWGREVRYKLIVYEPLLREYRGWKAKALGTAPPVYSPGRFSKETIYVDHEQAVARARNLPPAYAHLGLEGVLREIELRQVAYLAFVDEIPREAATDLEVRRAAITRLHERALWTAVRYGDPAAAVADVTGLAANEGVPEELRVAARRVRERLPAEREELHEAAVEAWLELARPLR